MKSSNLDRLLEFPAPRRFSVTVQVPPSWRWLGRGIGSPRPAAKFVGSSFSVDDRSGENRAARRISRGVTELLRFILAREPRLNADACLNLAPRFRGYLESKLEHLSATKILYGQTGSQRQLWSMKNAGIFHIPYQNADSNEDQITQRIVLSTGWNINATLIALTELLLSC